MTRTKLKTAPVAPANKPGDAPKDKPAGTDAEGKGRAPAAREVGGRDGLEPTRYGDWEKNGRCFDF